MSNTKTCRRPYFLAVVYPSPAMKIPAFTAALMMISASFAIGAEITPEQRTFFENRIRPVLAEQCYRCHSHEAKKLKADLYLDSRAAMLEGGESGPAIVPGDLEKSLLIEAVRYKNPDMQMPPKKKLEDAQIADFEKWVEMGAPWPGGDKAVAGGGAKKEEFDLEKRKTEHWVWQPVVDRRAPVVENDGWSDDPIDRFILAKLEERGLSPAAEADRRTLIRRVTYDLIGLPPEPEAVEAFVNDTSSDAWEKVIDALLASPHFGERWARHWMDLVRYAETCGHEFDYPIPHAHQYRDYLIRALNADVPYHQFVTEHVAGDLMRNPRLHPEEKYNESIIATGFAHFHEATHAPTDVRGDEAGRVDNQIDVLSKTFLGVTVACARCHDHKFDAISTKDYYAMAGYFQSSRRQEAMLDRGQRIAQGVAKLREFKAKGDAAISTAIRGTDLDGERFARYLVAARDVLIGGKDSLNDAGYAKVAKKYRVEPERLKAWVRALGSDASKKPTHPMHAWAEIAKHPGESTAAEFGRHRDGVHKRLLEMRKRAEDAEKDSVLLGNFEDGNFESSGWFVTGEAFGDAPTTAGDAMIADGKVRAADVGEANGGKYSKRLRGVLRSPTFTITHRNIHHRLRGKGVQVRLIVDSYVMDIYNGLLFRGCTIKNVDTKGQWRWQTQSGNVGKYLGHRAHLEYIDHGDGAISLDEVRLSNGGPPPERPSEIGIKATSTQAKTLIDIAKSYGAVWAKALADWRMQKPGKVNAQLVNWAINEGLVELDAGALEPVVREYADVEKSIPGPMFVQALTDGTAENEFVFLRGSHKKLGDEVPRRFLTALGGETITPPEKGSGRMALAEQIIDPKNPLTSRVITNRLWHYLFGRGIVPTTDDFGVLGQDPSHPELLDHLAATFVKRDAWSIKQMLKRIAMTKTYRMSSVASDAKAEESDPNNVYLHRANVRRLQGEAIRDGILAISGRLDRKLYGGSVPVHLTSFMTGRGRPGSGPLDGNGRRSIYTKVQRNFLSPMMIAFDTPIPFSTMGRRSVSNVPAQALIMMNDPFVVQQADVWAKRAMGEAKTAEDRIAKMYARVFSRPPTTDEISRGKAFVGASGGNDALPAWKDYAHVLLNTKEFIFVQ